MPKKRPFAETFLSALKDIETQLQGVREALDDLYSEFQWGLRNGGIVSTPESDVGLPHKNVKAADGEKLSCVPTTGREKRRRTNAKNELF
jgi:hypothetical protein